jgi:hypothetical protein
MSVANWSAFINEKAMWSASCAQSEPKGALGRDTFMNGFAALQSAFSFIG